MKVAEERRFATIAPTSRSTCARCRVALRRLRQLTRTGQATELDLDETIDETCRNAGEIELVFRAPRRNDVRVLLLMDVGGTMDPYYEPVSRLLTALHEERGLREFQPYYFHNCIYDHVFTTARMMRADAHADRRRAAPLDDRWKCRHRRRRRDASGRAARALRQHRSAPRRARPRGSSGCAASPSTSTAASGSTPMTSPTGTARTPARIIRRLFPMFHLSVDGLAEAMQALVGARA